MEKIWLKNYPAGVPAEVDVRRYRSLKEILEVSCERFRDLPAYTNMGTSITYGELDALSRNFAAYLQKRAGLARGSRVAIMLPNLLQYPVALFGTLRAGMTVVNVNPMYTPRELRHQLRDSGAEAIVVLENFAHTLQEVMADTPLRAVITTQVGDMLPPLKSALVNLVVKHVKHMVPPWRIEGAVGWRRALQAGAAQGLDEVAVEPEDVAFLQYTGGTTGVAKGAVLTHANMVANLEQTSSWLRGVLTEGAETVVTPLPLYHVFSLTANCLTFLKWGANNVLITNPRDLPAFLKQIKRLRFTVITGVNTLYNALLNAPAMREVDTRSLKIAVAGGMALQRAVATRWQEATGVTLIEGYGLTEASPIVCANPLDAKEFSGAAGMPFPSTELSIRDESGAELGIGQAGEVCVRGPQVMQGYWNRPEETAQTLSQDGWLRTGDIGVVDESGFLRIIDRKKDMIVVSGFKVFPNEIEDVVALHPGILESAAIGVPDERSGEAVKLVAVRKDASLTEAQLIEHCRKHLTGYKIPKLVEFRSEPLPKTPIGKVLRRALRDEELRPQEGRLMAAVATDDAVAATLPALRRWQAQRLARTYADLQADARYAPAVAFFLSDLYGEGDFTERQREVHKVYPLIEKTLPQAALAPFARALELDALSAELDAALCRMLVGELQMKGRITEPLYAEAYRRCGNRAQRLRQVRLVVSVGKDLDRVVARRLVYRMLMLARVPARSAGFGELQDFLERGFKAFRHMGGAGFFLQTIETRETLILERLFAGLPAPFDLTDKGK